MSRVLRHADGPNLSNPCVSVAFLFLITRTTADQSTFVGYLSEDCRRYSVDSYNVPFFMEIVVTLAWSIWEVRNDAMFRNIAPSF